MKTVFRFLWPLSACAAILMGSIAVASFWQTFQFESTIDEEDLSSRALLVKSMLTEGWVEVEWFNMGREFRTGVTWPSGEFGGIRRLEKNLPGLWWIARFPSWEVFIALCFLPALQIIRRARAPACERRHSFWIVLLWPLVVSSLVLSIALALASFQHLFTGRMWLVDPDASEFSGCEATAWEGKLQQQAWITSGDHHSFSIPLWEPIVVLSIWPVIRPLIAIRHRRRSRMCSCRVCGYSLTGNTSGVCPECGQ